MDKRIQIIANKLFKLKKLTTVQSTFAVNNMEEIKIAIDKLNKQSIIG